MLSLRQSSRPDSFAQADEEDLIPDPWRLVTFPVKVDTRDISDALLQAEGTLKLGTSLHLLRLQALHAQTNVMQT